MSAAGAAWVSHMRKHVREGKVREKIEQLGAGPPFYSCGNYYYTDIKTGKVVG